MLDQLTLYDLQTTGLEVRFVVPVQFAAVRTDGDFNVTHEVNLEGRLVVR